MQASRLLSNCKVIFKTKQFHSCYKVFLNKPKLCVRKSMLWCTKIPMETGMLSRYFNPIENVRYLCSPLSDPQELVDAITFEQVCEETLDSLSEYIEELVEDATHLKSSDVAYSDGVLTVSFSPPYGTYVINRQSPNRQIWLSSPTTGPKRYDYNVDSKTWIYKHDGVSLHQLLQNEMPKIIQNEVDFSKCTYSGF